MGELAQFNQRVHTIVLQSFNKAMYKDVVVIQGEEVLTPRPNEQGSQKLFVDTSKMWKEKLGRVGHHIG